jgi:pimeloyl-ACP methyl ester carboxylesterase
MRLKSQARLCLALAIALSPAFSRAASPSQIEPQSAVLSTGSEVATWSISPATLSHQTPIVFLHGGPGLYTEARRFDEGAPLRAAGFQTLYFDQVGGGRSKRLKAGDYSLDRAVADLEALRIYLGKEKMILWGNSYGASLAAIYAVRYPARVAALILTSPGTFPGTKPKRDYSLTNNAKADLGKAVSAAVSKIDSKGAAAEAEISQGDAGMLFDTVVAAELTGRMVCKGATISPPALAGGGNLFANRILLKSLEHLAFKPQAQRGIPTLILRGTCDFLPLSNAEAYGRLFGTVVTTIDASGHGLLENRTAVERAFRDFATGPLAAVE